MVYIVLGILYESFVHPLTILSTLLRAATAALLLAACRATDRRDLIAASPTTPATVTVIAPTGQVDSQTAWPTQRLAWRIAACPSTRPRTCAGRR